MASERIKNKYGKTEASASEASRLLNIPIKFIQDTQVPTAWHHSNLNVRGGCPVSFYNLDCLLDAWHDEPDHKKWMPLKKEETALVFLGHKQGHYFDSVLSGGFFSQERHDFIGKIFKKGDWYVLPGGKRKKIVFFD